ncbi:MAG: prepilin-type N-terminal cleavage/methylation domain-containing protein [Elusimicrobia bacterium]|nr:prepilin-type N-terminal cleavage/methylation domain-containing protein [Elusimicrobiota bacterium]
MEASTRGEGFTLLELLIVVVVVGILAMLALPRYRQTLEASRAEAAAAQAELIASANQMARLDKPPGSQTYETGEIVDNTHALVTGGYLVRQDWSRGSWRFYAADLPGSPSYLAQALHRLTGGAPYESWGYQVTPEGTVLCLPSPCDDPGNPPAPSR